MAKISRKIKYLIVGLTTFGLSSFYYIFHFYTHVIKYSNTPHVLALKANPFLCVSFNMGLALETTVLMLAIFAIIDNFMVRCNKWEK